jgi:hypothetical protein
MSDGSVIAVLGAVGMLVTAIVTAMITYFSARRQHKREDIDDAVRRHQQLNDEIEKRHKGVSELLSRQLIEMSEALEEIESRHRDCEVRIEGLYEWCKGIYRIAVRQARQLKLDPDDEVPELPPRPQRPDSDAEYKKRSLLHNAQLLQQQIRNPTPPQGGTS